MFRLPVVFCVAEVLPDGFEDLLVRSAMHCIRPRLVNIPIPVGRIDALLVVTQQLASAGRGKESGRRDG